MTKPITFWGGAATLFGLMVLTIVVTPATIDRTDPITLSQTRTLLHHAGIPDLRGMAYAPDPIAAMPEGVNVAADINRLLKDFPTAAGTIHEQALANQQYLAASEGNYEQAMRLMGMSFVSSEGSGSYTTKW